MRINNRISALILSSMLLTSVGCKSNTESSSAETSASTTANAPEETAEQAATSEHAETSKTSIITTEVEIEITTTEVSIDVTMETDDIITVSAEPATTESAEAAAAEPPSAAAPFAGLYRADSMECIYEQKGNEAIYPASLTKVLTACTALKYASPDTVYTVGSELAMVQPHSSLCLIQWGHRLTLRDLLTGMLLSSGNDAAYTIAVNVARDVAENPDMGDEEAAAYFVDLMNDYASQLGAENSHFTTPDGWDDPEQQTTVYDLALISAHAMQYDEIREIAATPIKNVVFESGEYVTWFNTNALIHPENQHYLPQAVGLKTGSTDLAGKCVIAVLDVDGTEYIAISANCSTTEERYETIHQMVEKIK